MIFRNLIIKNLTKKINFISLSKVLVSIGLLIHFFIIFLSQTNDNPIKHQYTKEINNYVNPFFSQAWTLFAPNPINTNMSLLVMFRYEENGITKNTQWIDISSPIIEHRKKHFFSSMQRISKFTQSSMSDINNNQKEILDYISKNDTLKNDSIKSKQFYLKNISNSQGHLSIIRFSKSISTNYFFNNKIDPKNIHVKYRIIEAKFPRFSKRDKDYYDLKEYEFKKID